MQDALIKYEGLPQDDMSDAAVFQKILRALRCSPERWEELLRCASQMGTIGTHTRLLEEKCRTLEGQCELLTRIVRYLACPANVNFSKITIDEFSDDSQVKLDRPVTGLGGDYQDSFPVPPGKRIRLEHAERPGWTPVEIRVDLNLTNGASNYLDLEIQFYLGPGDRQHGKAIGSAYSGNQFLNKDGSQIKMPFPKYKGEPINVGSLERLGVEIRNRSGGGTNIESVQVVVLYDNDNFYRMCGGALLKGGCATGTC